MAAPKNREIFFERIERFKTILKPVVGDRCDRQVRKLLCHCAYYKMGRKKVLGNEERGCSTESIKSSDAYINIPLFGKKNSLNVACAFAIIASEISRQKRRP